MRVKSFVYFCLVFSMAASGLCISKVGPIQPKMDLVFCVDTTRSMSDEIDMVKERMRDMIAKIAEGTPVPKVRVGVVAYRDRGDEYVVKKFALTDDLDAAVAMVTSLQSNGGGDKEESVNAALHAAVSEMNWDTTRGITRLVYLIGDAGPNRYPDDYNPEIIRREALKRGIVINAIACSGITDQEAKFFREMSQGTEGLFAYLTYREEYQASDGTRRVILREADRVYEYSPAIKPSGAGADWREGASAAAKVGAARCVAVPASLVTYSPRGLFPALTMAGR